MPTYVYRNLTTQEIFEVKQSMKDAALTQHPETGEPVKRLVSAPAIAFKGSGFYANDSRAASKSAAPISSAESAKADSGKAEGGPSADSASPAASTSKAEASKPAEKSSPATNTSSTGSSTKSTATPGGSNQ